MLPSLEPAGARSLCLASSSRVNSGVTIGRMCARRGAAIRRQHLAYSPAIAGGLPARQEQAVPLIRRQSRRWIPANAGAGDFPSFPSGPSDQDDPEIDKFDPAATREVLEKAYKAARRSVVELVVLYRLKPAISFEAAEAMMNGLWGLQYQVAGVVFVSIGANVHPPAAPPSPGGKLRGFSHAMHARFPDEACRERFLASPKYAAVVRDLAAPLTEWQESVSYTGQLDDSIEAIFRRGNDWDAGLERFELFTARDDGGSDGTSYVDDAVATGKRVGAVQLTAGQAHAAGQYTHALAARFLSRDDAAEFAAHMHDINVGRGERAGQSDVVEIWVGPRADTKTTQI